MTSPMTPGSAPGGGSGPTYRVPERVPVTTGRYLVVFGADVGGDETAMADTLRSVTGASSILSASDFGGGRIDTAQARGAEATMLPALGLAVVSVDPSRATTMRGLAAGDGRIVAVEPELIHHVLGPRPAADGLSAEYLRGYRDAVAHLYELATAGAVAEGPLFADTDELTWGLQATAAAGSPFTGAGIRLAVLDTGLTLGHPDLDGRTVVAESFIDGETAEDGHGHGTHCVGTAAGSTSPPRAPEVPRYGVAPDVEIYAGKVLSNEGSGDDTGILSGINWALENGCAVISMSLGADVETVSTAYETVGRRALAAGSLIVAAAGNNARRADGDPGFVGIPANSPSIMAVAAVDPNLVIADFSARSNPVEGGQIDIAGPGVDVFSSWTLPDRYTTISGTSMATPHVAGIAALWSEATGLTGEALWARLTEAAIRLEEPSVDVGAGLVRAPVE
ncbi:MAG: S8 family serine peptidase [Actinomycetota bacterium]|nr:S8 family serine peptidase [Actinomycetota bacterium]